MNGGFVIGMNAHNTFIHDCTVRDVTTLSNAAPYGVVWYPDPAAMTNNPTQGPVVPAFSLARNCVVSNCSFINIMGSEYIRVGGVSNLVVNNYLANGQSSDVFQAFGAYNIIRGNHITNFTLVDGFGQHPDMFQSYGQDGNPASQADPWFDSYNILCENNQFWDCCISFGQFENGDTNINPIIKFGNWTFRNNLYVRCGTVVAGSVGNFALPGTVWAGNTYLFCATNTLASGGPIYLLNHVQPDCNYPYHYRGNATNCVVVNNAFIACGTGTNSPMILLDNERPHPTNGWWGLQISNNFAVFWDGANWRKMGTAATVQTSSTTCNGTNYTIVDTYMFPPDVNPGTNPQVVQLDAHYAGHVRPMNGSPLIGSGANASAWDTNDIQGGSRLVAPLFDVGAFQFDPALRLHLDFNESFSAGKVTDVSGYGNHGWNFQSTNWITSTNGVSGGLSAHFWTNGVMINDPGQTYILSTYIGVTNLAGILEMPRATISVWAKLDHNKDYAMRLFDNGFNNAYATDPVAASNSWAIARNYDSVFSFIFYPGSGGITNILTFPHEVIQDQGSQIDLGTTNWNLYTVTVDCILNQAIGYFNGTPFATNALNAPSIRVYGCGTQRWLCIGAMSHDGTPQWGDDNYPNDGFMEGNLDDVRIYSRVLSPSEIGNLYAPGVGTPFLGGGGQPVSPTILQQPQSLTVAAGANATFSVGASGTSPLSYQWMFNGGNVAGATASSYTRTSVQISDGGSYSVLVSNIAGMVTSAGATLTVQSNAVAPSIISQPQSTSVAVGSSAGFSVTASGTAPLAYQWRFNGTNLTGATASTYTNPSVQLNNAGNYAVVVTNLAGSLTSSIAVLTVTSPTGFPTIATQPQSLSVSQGADATFWVSATGSPPLQYQWVYDGALIPGATGSSYVRSNAQSEVTGTYWVRVSNNVGAVTSAGAVLTVSEPSLKLHLDFNEDFSIGQVQDVSGNGAGAWQMDITNRISTAGGIMGASAGQFSYVGTATNRYNQTFPLSQYLAVTNVASFEYLTNATISFWAKFDTNTDLAMNVLSTGANAQYAGDPVAAANSWTICRDSSSYLQLLVYPTGGGKQQVISWPDDTVQPGGAVPILATTNFHLYTVTLDCAANRAVAYYDGQPYMTNLINVPWLHVYGCSSARWLAVGSATADGTPQWGDDGVPSWGFFVGKLDDIRIYGRTLSAADVADLASGTSLLPRPSPPTGLHVVGP
jgi:hypothetical protein